MPLGSICQKIFSETTRAKASIFGVQHFYVELYINPANHPPGVRNSPTLGVQHKKKSSYLCIAMYSTSLHKFCQLCPWSPYRTHTRGVIIFHRLIMELHDKIFSETARPKACNFLVCSNKSCQSCPWVQIWPHNGVIIGHCHYMTLSLYDDFLSEPKWWTRG